MTDPALSRNELLAIVAVANLRHGQMIFANGRTVGAVERVIAGDRCLFVELIEGGSESYPEDATVEVLADA